jgi:hypothetical protein
MRETEETNPGRIRRDMCKTEKNINIQVLVIVSFGAAIIDRSHECDECDISDSITYQSAMSA